MFNLGNFGEGLRLPEGTDKALQIAGGAGQRTQLPPGTQEALRKTGSSYQLPSQGAPASAQAPSQGAAPSWVGNAQQGASLLDATSMIPGAKRANELPITQLAKKVVGAVAAFYTGGMSAVATNIAGNMLSKNNPRLGAAANAVGSFL